MSPPRLENRLPPEDLPERDEHPLRDLAWLLAASLAALALALLVRATGSVARWVAPQLPFKHEQAWAERLFDEGGGALQGDTAARERRLALQALADRVAAVIGLPLGMRVMVSDEPSAVVIAYATIGGRIRVFHGLRRRLPSEEALAALLAHEAAHVKHRHVAAGMGLALAVSLLQAVVWPEGGAQAAQAVLGGAVNLALLGYSRDAVRQADADALADSGGALGGAGLRPGSAPGVGVTGAARRGQRALDGRFLGGPSLATAADHRALIHNFVDEPSGFAGLACWPAVEIDRLRRGPASSSEWHQVVPAPD